MPQTAKELTAAIYAAVVAGLGSLSAVLVGDTGIGDLTAGQWVIVVLAAVVAFGGVLRLPNNEVNGAAPPPSPGG